MFHVVIIGTGHLRLLINSDIFKKYIYKSYYSPKKKKLCPPDSGNFRAFSNVFTLCKKKKKNTVYDRHTFYFKIISCEAAKDSHLVL